MLQVELNRVNVLDNPGKFSDAVKLEILFSCFEELQYGSILLEFFSRLFEVYPIKTSSGKLSMLEALIQISTIKNWIPFWSARLLESTSLFLRCGSVFFQLLPE